MSIQIYLQRHLIPHLSARGLGDDQIQRVAEDVGSRLSSVICRWNDRSFRKTILLLGQEEATFWEPAEVDLAVRSLVVVGIRNSLLEDLASTTEAARQLGLPHPVLPDDEMPMLTREAIQFFGDLNLARAGKGVKKSATSDDVFGGLPTRYPVTWRALGELAGLEDAEASYAPVSALPPCLPIGRPAEMAVGARDGPRVLSGMAQHIEPELQRMLRLVRTGIYPGLFSDSFKMITRNPQKLFAVMEFVLANDRAVVTQNYYLRNGYVARRTPLVRPAHTINDSRVKFFDQSGLLPGHVDAIARFAPARI